jgi:uncharacterized membrane protein
MLSIDTNNPAQVIVALIVFLLIYASIFTCGWTFKKFDNGEPNGPQGWNLFFNMMVAAFIILSFLFNFCNLIRINL